MEDIYTDCRINIDGFDSYENFLRKVRKLDFTSSPGYPYMCEAPTIGDWLKFNGCDFDEIQLARLWISVQQILSGDVDSLWRVFIKMEPHKMTKAQTNRWRLIMCPPLHVQVLWQMVFSDQNDVEVRKALSLPSQQGIQLCAGHWKFYRESWLRRNLTVSADKTAWDWTCHEWMIKLDLRLRTRLVYGNDVNKWQSAALKLYDDAFQRPKLLISTGQVLQQAHYGVMKSGCVNTISTNSRCQLMLHLLYSNQKRIDYNPLLVAVGDDTLQNRIHVADIGWYARYGVRIKQVVKALEFVGHDFTGEPVPLYRKKHLYRYIHCDEAILPDLLESYLYLYVNDR